MHCENMMWRVVAAGVFGVAALRQRIAARRRAARQGRDRLPGQGVAAVLGLLMLGAMHSVHAVPLATTSVHVGCVAIAEGYFISLGPEPAGLSTNCDYVITGDTGTASTVASVSAGFGPGFPLVGNVAANASAYSDPFGAVSEASASGSVLYYFEIQAIRAVPGEPPLVLPVLFGARGEGTTSASGTFASAGSSGAAWLGAPGFTGEGFSFSGTGGSFDNTISISLLPDSVYDVSLFASCGVTVNGEALPGDPPVSLAGSASCSASVDPLLAFDQVGFDVLMGADTFVLSDFYRFVVSENVVPLPAAVWLFGSGLLGLMGVMRRKARAAQRDSSDFKEGVS